MSIKLIREIPLFANCSIECLRLVSEKLKQACFAPGQTVVSAGEEGHEMFLVGHGMLEVLSEQSKPIATISDGQFFGEMALLGDSSRVATVRAKSYCDAYILEKEDFLAILSEFEDVQRNVESIVAKRQKTLDQH